MNSQKNTVLLIPNSSITISILSMKSIFYLVLLQICFATYTMSQEETKPSLKPFEFSLRMKGITFVIIEDLWPRAHSIGFQCRFNEHFGFVADVVNFQWKREQEIYTEPGNYEDYYEVNQKDDFYYLATELRYYPFRIGTIKNCMPYINLYSKIGKRKLRSQSEYTPNPGNPFNINSTFHDVGASLGIEIGDVVGFDANLGFCYRWENKSQDIFYGSNQPLHYDVREQHNRFLANIRISFYWNFMGRFD